MIILEVVEENVVKIEDGEVFFKMRIEEALPLLLKSGRFERELEEWMKSQKKSELTDTISDRFTPEQFLDFLKHKRLHKYVHMRALTKDFLYTIINNGRVEHILTALEYLSEDDVKDTLMRLIRTRIDNSTLLTDLAHWLPEKHKEIFENILITYIKDEMDYILNDFRIGRGYYFKLASNKLVTIANICSLKRYKRARRKFREEIKAQQDSILRLAKRRIPRGVAIKTFEALLPHLNEEARTKIKTLITIHKLRGGEQDV